MNSCEMYRRFLENIMPIVEKYIIKNNEITMYQDDENFFEVIKLYAKQHKLLKAAMLLMENDMNEEAMIIARSAINNYFLIQYLLNDDSKERIKRYKIQPLIVEKRRLQHIKKMMVNDYEKKLKEKGMSLGYKLEDISEGILSLEEEIKQSGVNGKVLRVYDLIEKSCESEDMYKLQYAYASKFEHCDISTLDIYKENINLIKDNEFIINIDKTDYEIKDRIYAILRRSYITSFKVISLYIIRGNLYDYYSTDGLDKILKEIGLCKNN